MKTQQKTTNNSFQKQIKNGLLHFFFSRIIQLILWKTILINLKEDFIMNTFRSSKHKEISERIKEKDLLIKDLNTYVEALLGMIQHLNNLRLAEAAEDVFMDSKDDYEAKLNYIKADGYDREFLNALDTCKRLGAENTEEIRKFIEK